MVLIEWRDEFSVGVPAVDPVVGATASASAVAAAAARAGERRRMDVLACRGAARVAT